MMEKLKNLRNEYTLLIILIGLITVMSLISPDFFSAENFFDILRSSTFVGICSVGFLVVLISGGVDISFTATATVAQYVMGLMLVSSRGFPVVCIILAPLLIGAVLGMVNAILINRLKVSAIIVTIATLNIYYGAIQFASKGAWLYSFPDWFTSFSKIRVISFTNQEGVPYGLSILTVIWMVSILAGMFLLNYTSLGRKIFAIGGNLESAHRVGINVNRIRLFTYSFLGMIAGIGAIIYTLTTRTVAPNAMMGLEFNVLSAVVLGGASISGGKGSVSGTVIGVLLIAVLTNGLTIMKVPNYWHQVFIGLMLLMSVSITALREKTLMNKEGIDVDKD
ncbi:MAG: ABC transporter permease [Candidatus Vecturithrix sp.]|jgi:simple sugar transport system permease protein|nr:ABC transporter permease [Candidatus Vecturithrix sp.]